MQKYLLEIAKLLFKLDFAHKNLI